MIALLEDVPLPQAHDEPSIRRPNLAETCAGDRGLCQDVRSNLAVVLARVDDDLDEEAATRVYGRLAARGRGHARHRRRRA